MAEQVGLDLAFVSDDFQPWKHVDGHAPSSWSGRARWQCADDEACPGSRVLTLTFAITVHRRAGFGTLGAMAPGRRDPGHRHWRGANEAPSTGAPWPFRERFAGMREAVMLTASCGARSG